MIIHRLGQKSGFISNKNDMLWAELHISSALFPYFFVRMHTIVNNPNRFLRVALIDFQSNVVYTADS